MIDFPDSPATNDTFTVGDRTWVFDGVAWVTHSTTGGGSGPELSDDNPSYGAWWPGIPGVSVMASRADHEHPELAPYFSQMRGENGAYFNFTGDGTVMSVSSPDSMILWLSASIIKVFDRTDDFEVLNADTMNYPFTVPTVDGHSYRVVGWGLWD